MGGKDGLVHVSEMKNERVEKPTDVVKEGQEVFVKVLEIDQRGKVRLSMRVVDQETGGELEDTRPPREPREPRAIVATVVIVAATVVPAEATVVRVAKVGAIAARRDREEGGNPDHMPAFLKSED
jgi:polyribonucleotide nucleotidyltransferase